MLTNIILAVALAPSVLLIGWALWVHFKQPARADDFMERRDDWGAF